MKKKNYVFVNQAIISIGISSRTETGTGIGTISSGLKRWGNRIGTGWSCRTVIMTSKTDVFLNMASHPGNLVRIILSQVAIFNPRYKAQLKTQRICLIKIKSVHARKIVFFLCPGIFFGTHLLGCLAISLSIHVHIPENSF